MIASSFGTGVPDREAFRACLTSPAQQPVNLSGEPPIHLERHWRGEWPVRDQFGRGTCVAFGVVAAVELDRALRIDMAPERLSEQFVDNRMRTAHGLTDVDAAGLPEGAALLRQARAVIEEDGLIAAERFPYRPAAHGTSEAGPAPGADLLAEAQRQRFTCRAYGRVGTVPPGGAPDIDYFRTGDGIAARLLAFLKDRCPVAIGLPLFVHVSGLANWTLPQALATGVVHCPLDAGAPAMDGPRDDGHVVCLTGFRPDPDEPAGGWFTFRNSWGLEFAARALGDDPVPSAAARGYGVLSATHVEQYCWEYLVPCPAPSQHAAAV